MKTGIEIISEEYDKQSKKWGSLHDDTHDKCELLDAAQCYIKSAALVNQGGCGYDDCEDHWPFEEEAWKPSEDEIDSLAKAGAFIASEIDRILRTRE